MGDKAEGKGSEALGVLTARTDYGIFDYTQTPLEQFVENLASELLNKLKLSVLTPVQKPTYPGNQGLEVLALQRGAEELIDGQGDYDGKNVKVSFKYLRYPSEQTNKSITKGFVHGDTDYLKKNAVRLYIDGKPRAEYVLLNYGERIAVVSQEENKIEVSFRTADKVKDALIKTARDGLVFYAHWRDTAYKAIEKALEADAVRVDKPTEIWGSDKWPKLDFIGSSQHRDGITLPEFDRQRAFATAKNYLIRK